MKGPWSSMTIVMAAAAACLACMAAAAAPAEAGASIMAYGNDGLIIPLLVGAAVEPGDMIEPLRAWFGDSYNRAPALMLGLSVLLFVPVLALVGFIATKSRPRTSPDATVLIRSRRARSEIEEAPAPKTRAHAAQPAKAWVETENGNKLEVGLTMIRIGREADNDIRLSDMTVHRYHAIIRRTTDGEVMITDVSGDDGNGVLVNGSRIAEARLTRGDVINVGKIKLRFDAQMS